jgi:hypothetical protein
MAQSRHSDSRNECPLSGVKRTSKFESVMSAFDQNRTLAVRCGDDFEAGFGPYQSARVTR